MSERREFNKKAKDDGSAVDRRRCGQPLFYSGRARGPASSRG